MGAGEEREEVAGAVEGGGVWRAGRWRWRRRETGPRSRSMEGTRRKEEGGPELGGVVGEEGSELTGMVKGKRGRERVSDVGAAPEGGEVWGVGEGESKSVGLVRGIG